jgi:hypothetical protein
MTRHGNRDDAGVEIITAVVNPTDRIRWGPILGGVFASITAAAILSTLGAAIGLSAYSRTGDPRTFAVTAGFWGVITMILAYGLGGWIAARSAALRGKNTGLLNGAMVAGVGIPLMLFMLGSAGAMMGAAAASSDRDASAMRARDTGRGAVADSFDSASQAAGRITPGEPAGSVASGGGSSASGGGGGSAAPSEDAARAASRAAWGTLIALLLAILSAAAGGYLGGRGREEDRDTSRDRTGTPTVA